MADCTGKGRGRDGLLCHEVIDRHGALAVRDQRDDGRARQGGQHVRDGRAQVLQVRRCNVLVHDKHKRGAKRRRSREPSRLIQ